MKTETTSTGLQCYYPEMDQPKPEAQIEASLGHFGKHWNLKSQIELQGRGITLLNVLTSSQLTPQAQHKVGWRQYRVTETAFDKICSQHRVSSAMLL